MAASHGAGSLKSTSINGVKLYSLTGGRYVAPWVVAKKKRALRKDKGTSGTHTQAFPSLSVCVCVCGDIRCSDEGKLRCFGCRVSAEAGFDPRPEVRDRHHQDQADAR
jgi:hypothetical protein